MLLLTATGYYGTQHYRVADDGSDYAILAALGAARGRFSGSCSSAGLRYGLPGLLLGAPLAVGIVLAARRLRHERGVADVTALVAGGIACLLPAATSGPAREARDLEPAPLLKED